MRPGVVCVTNWRADLRLSVFHSLGFLPRGDACQSVAATYAYVGVDAIPIYLVAGSNATVRLPSSQDFSMKPRPYGGSVTTAWKVPSKPSTSMICIASMQFPPPVVGRFITMVL